MTFEKAIAFCDNLEESGFDDWRLPEIHEIRTLADKCLEEENSDHCAVTDSCEWNNCETELCGKCVKYEENFESGSFWTKTLLHGDKVSVFTIEPEKAETVTASKNEKHSAKCVRDR